ncbi:MAG: hypothetical protein LC777_11985 [Actinobacteria bacterium]|nr:hypothetical protein [Actinomycetota bacterium]
MPAPFDTDRDQRRQWWDERLWLQMLAIGAIIVLDVVIVYGLSVYAILAAGVCTVLIYVLARSLMRAR